MSETDRLEERLRAFGAEAGEGADWDDVLRRSGKRISGLRFSQRLQFALAAALVVTALIVGTFVARATESDPTGAIGATHCDTPRWLTCPGRRGTQKGTWPPHEVDFSASHVQHPVAGQMFEGMAIINRTGLLGKPYGFFSVRCDAEIGGKRLRAKHQVYGKPRRGYVQVVVCGWRIPADAAGKTLRFWKNSAFGGWHGADVVFTRGETVGGPPLTWRVKSS